MLSCFGCGWLFATPWTVARQAPLSMGFFRQEYWSGLPCLSLGDLPNTRIKSGSLQFSSVQLLSRVWLFVTPWIAACLASPELASRFFTTSNTWEALINTCWESIKDITLSFLEVSAKQKHILICDSRQHNVEVS